MSREEDLKFLEALLGPGLDDDTPEAPTAPAASSTAEPAAEAADDSPGGDDMALLAELLSGGDAADAPAASDTPPVTEAAPAPAPTDDPPTDDAPAAPTGRSRRRPRRSDRHAAAPEAPDPTPEAPQPTPEAPQPTPAAAAPEEAPRAEEGASDAPRMAALDVPPPAEGRYEPNLPIPTDPVVAAKMAERAGVVLEERPLPGFLEGLLGIVAEDDDLPRDTEGMVGVFETAAGLREGPAAAPEVETEAGTAEETTEDATSEDAAEEAGVSAAESRPAPDIEIHRPDDVEAPAAAQGDEAHDEGHDEELAVAQGDDEGLPPLAFDSEEHRAAAIARWTEQPESAPTQPEPAEEAPAEPAPAAAEQDAVPAVAAAEDPTIASLVEALTSFDVSRRRAALVALLDRQLAGELVKAAASSLRDPETDLRFLAIQVLERAPELAPVDALRAAMLDPNAGMRRRAMTLVGRTGRLDLVSELYERLAEESDQDVVAAGVTAMADIFRVTDGRGEEPALTCAYMAVGRLPAAALPQLERELALLSHALDHGETLHRLGAGDETVRSGAAVLALESGSEESLKILGRLVTDTSPRVRRLAMAAVARARSDHAAPITTPAPETEEDADEPVMSRAVSDEVERALLPGLLEALADPKPEIRDQARNALALVDRARLVAWMSDRAGDAGPDELIRLVDATRRLDLTDVAPRLAAAALGLQSATARRQVGAALRELPPVRELVGRWQASSDPAERSDAIRLAGLVTPDDQSPILRGLEDSNATVRLAAITASRGHVEDRLAEALLDLVRTDPSSRVRVATLEAFRTSPPHERIAAAAAAAESTLPEVRKTGLTLLTGESGEEFQRLAGGLRDSDAAVVEQAATLLVGTGAPEALALLWGELRTADDTSRHVILDVLRTEDPNALARLARRSVDSADPAERVAGLSALASVGESDVLDQLLTSLSDPSVEVRLEALRALSAESGAFSVGPLVAVLRDAEPRVRAAAIDVIADVEDEEALPHLLTALDDPSEAVRTRARRALGRMRSPATVELLLGAIQRPAHRAVAIEALGELGEVATPHLLRALTEAEGEVRTAIREALLRSGIVERTLRVLENPSPARRTAALGILRAVRPVGIAPAVVARLSDPAPEVRLQAAHLLGELGDPAAVPALQNSFVADPDMDVVAAVEDAYRKLSGGESGA